MEKLRRPRRAASRLHGTGVFDTIGRMGVVVGTTGREGREKEKEEGAEH